MVACMELFTTTFHSDEDGRLVASECVVCGAVACPPRLGHCNRPVRSVALSPDGVIVSWTEVHVAPERFRPPYLIAYVRLDAGPLLVVRLTTRITGGLTGCRVRLTLEGPGPGPLLLVGSILSRE